MGPARKIDSQEHVFPSIGVGMQSLNASLAPSLDMSCEWACSQDVEQTIARNTKGEFKGAPAGGRKTAVFFPGGDMGDRKPQGLGEATAAPCLVCSLHFSRTNH